MSSSSFEISCDLSFNARLIPLVVCLSCICILFVTGRRPSRQCYRQSWPQSSNSAAKNNFSAQLHFTICQCLLSRWLYCDCVKKKQQQVVKDLPQHCWMVESFWTRIDITGSGLHSWLCFPACASVLSGMFGHLYLQMWVDVGTRPAYCEWHTLARFQGP